MSCVYVPVSTIRLDLAFGFVCLVFIVMDFCLALSRLVLPFFCFVLSCLVDVRSTKTQSYAWVLSLVVFVFAPGPIMFPMGAVALGSICCPEAVL